MQPINLGFGNAFSLFLPTKMPENQWHGRLTLPSLAWGKINAENEIHPLIMNRRVDASSAPKPNPAATEEDHKRWREMRRERSNSNAQNGRPRRRRRGHRKAGKKNRMIYSSLNRAPTAKFTQPSKLENLSEFHAFSCPDATVVVGT